MALLQKANRRFLLRHPLQLALAILGIAIGVATAVAVDLAVTSARSAFESSMTALLGSTTHHIVGSGNLVDESLYPTLRRAFPGVPFSPVVEGTAESAGEALRLNGIDVFAAGEGAGRRSFPGVLPALPGLLLQPGSVLIARSTAESLRLAAGSSLVLDVGGVARSAQILGILEGQGKPDPALEGLLLADIATAQELLGKVGQLDRIDAVLPDNPQLQRQIAARLPPSVQLISAEARTQATGRLASAFETNLQAMSLLGLVVGLFLIYNTMTFAVLQRREVLAILRLLGATRTEILREIVVESLLLGILGSAIGLLLGTVVADLLLDRVTRTINDVYFVLTARQLDIAPAVLLRGFLLGLGTSFLAALVPAIEAAGTRPLWSRARSRLEESNRRSAAWGALFGLVVIAVATAALWAPNPTLVRSIAALFLLLLGCGLAIPALVWILGRPFRSLGTLLFRLGIADVIAALSRTGVAVAALAMAFAAALGVGIMTASFRATVTDWLQQLMQADLYVSRPSAASRAGESFPPGLVERLAALPGVAAVSSARRQFVESSLGKLELMALEPADPGRPAYRFKDSGDRDPWSRFLSEEVVLVSEPFASRYGVGTGDALRLATASGLQEFPIAGIFYDYRSDQGIVLMARALYARHWQDDGVSSVGLLLAPNGSQEAVRMLLKHELGEDQSVQIRSNREIRDASLALFDRTFAITELLRLLAVGVALTGLVASLLTLQLERLREFATLRALGMTPGQLTILVLVQSSFIGLCAGFLALPLGLLVAWVLVAVIQFVSFGWSMDMTVPTAALWQTPALAWGAALLAGLYPAWRAGRSTPAAALREE